MHLPEMRMVNHLDGKEVRYLKIEFTIIESRRQSVVNRHDPFLLLISWFA
jgi:hypothetical protein